MKFTLHLQVEFYLEVYLAGWIVRKKYIILVLKLTSGSEHQLSIKLSREMHLIR